jgi:hypothetical protein
MDKDGFKKPRYPARTKPPPSQQGLPLENQYDSLTDSDASMNDKLMYTRKQTRNKSKKAKVGSGNDVHQTEDTDDSVRVVDSPRLKRKKIIKNKSQKQDSEPKEKSKQPKPIISNGLKHNALQEKLSTMKLTSKPICKILSGNRVKVIPQNKEDKQTIVNGLKTSQINFHTYTEDEDRQVFFVLKGYENDEPQVVLAALQESGTKATRVSTLYQREDFAIFLVAFNKATTTIDELKYNHRIINYLQVRWEVFNNSNKRLTQCHHCQRWGHSSFNCGFQKRCVKCTEAHGEGQCKRISKEQEGEPSCVNCGQAGHPANSSTCEAYKNFKKSIDTQKKKTVRHPTTFTSTAAPWSQPPTINNTKLFPNLSPSESAKSTPSTSHNHVQGECNRPALNNPRINSQPARQVTQSQDDSDPLRQFAKLNEEFSSISGIREAVKIYSDLIQKLKSCSDPNAQARVLLEFSLTQK